MLKLKELLVKHREVISYGFWGVATTAVNYVVYFLCTQWLQINYLLSNIIAWVVAVAFAFFVNKAYVFASRSWKLNAVFGELWRFVFGRVLSGVMETLVMFVFVDLLRFHDGIIKIAVGVLVVVVNYVVSKLLVFRKPKTEDV